MQPGYFIHKFFTLLMVVALASPSWLWGTCCCTRNATRSLSCCRAKVAVPKKSCCAARAAAQSLATSKVAIKASTDCRCRTQLEAPAVNLPKASVTSIAWGDSGLVVSRAEAGGLVSPRIPRQNLLDCGDPLATRQRCAQLCRWQV